MAKFSVRMQTPGKSHANQYFTLSASGSDSSNEVKLKVCRAGAEVLITRLREHLEATTNDPNRKIKGTLARSLTATDGFSGVIVSPKGKHHGSGSGRKTRAAGYHRAKTGQGTSHLRKHHGMTKAVSATDVGYYLEYGTPRMSAEHWMETTLEKAEDEIVEAMEAEWNAYLDSQGV